MGRLKMKRERKKPEETFIERTRQEFENEKITLGKQAYELGRIRGRKEMIEKACEWLYKWNQEQAIKNGVGNVVSPIDYTINVTDFRKAMEGNSGNKEEIPSKLTWQDVKEIVTIADNALGQFGSRSWLASEEAYYTEVLRRLNEKKED